MTTVPMYITDVVGKKHLIVDDGQWEENGKKRAKTVSASTNCPACDSKNGNAAKKCNNKPNCCYTFKPPNDAAAVHQAAVLRIRKSYR
jgi:hypothetical protein